MVGHGEAQQSQAALEQYEAQERARLASGAAAQQSVQPPATVGPGGPDLLAQLQPLDELRASEILSDDEFAQPRPNCSAEMIDLVADSPAQAIRRVLRR